MTAVHSTLGMRSLTVNKIGELRIFEYILIPYKHMLEGAKLELREKCHSCNSSPAFLLGSTMFGTVNQFAGETVSLKGTPCANSRNSKMAGTHW